MTFSMVSVQRGCAAALFILTGALSYLMLRDSPSSLLKATQNESPRPGSHIAVQADIWRQHDRTLVLAVRRGCHYCEASMPFYRKLSRMNGEHSLRIPVILESPDDPITMQFLITSQGLRFATVASTPLQALQVEGTPTALLVDQQGTVLHSWSGELDAQQETELVKVLERR